MAWMKGPNYHKEQQAQKTKGEKAETEWKEAKRVIGNEVKGN